jgi:hypothetical protein
MTLNKKSSFLLQITACFILILVVFSCANIQRPMGGPRDKTPPKLLKATPANPTRNFNAKIIQLDFDEYFKLNSTYQEITISPDMGKLPEYLIKKKSLVIKLKDTLSKNTTYVINFGKAIADVNEGNILKNFTYVFSTGPHIDSLSIMGTVKNVLTQHKEKDVTVMLFPAKRDSFAFGKKKPAIYATTDTAGNFVLSNLKQGDYNIYALSEKSPNKIYDNEEELIGFVPRTIHLTKDTANIQLVLFKQSPVRLRPIERKIDADGKLLFVFNKPIPNIGVRILDPKTNLLDTKLDAEKIVDFSKTADTAMIYLRDMTFDSVRVSFMNKDTPLDTITLRRTKRETYKRSIAISYNMSFDKLKPGTALTLLTNYPIEAVDQSRIILLEDSTEVNDFTLQRDITSGKKFTFNYKWRADKVYTATFNAGTFTDIYGDKNARLVKKFSLDKPENYSQLTLKVKVPEKGKNYLVQLYYDNSIEVKSTTITQDTAIVYRNYPSAKYRVKVIYDENRNGKWDTGNLKQKLQPENIWIYDKPFTLRTNFEIEEDVVIPKEEKATP